MAVYHSLYKWRFILYAVIAAVLVCVVCILVVRHHPPVLAFRCSVREALAKTGIVAPPADEALIASVLAAIEQQVLPREVERWVGVPATFNTLDLNQRIALRRSAIAPDDARQSTCSLKELRNAQNVVLWLRPGQHQTPQCVGIVWSNDEAPKLFFGVILAR
jgi:hypothetical protein